MPERGLQGLFGFYTFPHRIGYPLAAGTMAFYLTGLVALARRNWGFWKSLSGAFRLEVFALIFSLILPLLLAFRMEGMFLHYYLFPLFPFVCMALSKITQRDFLQKSIAGFCLVACLTGDLFMIRFDKMGETLKRQGYSYSLWAADFEEAFLKLGGDSLLFEKIGVFLKGRPASFRRIIYQALTEASFKMEGKKDLEKKLQFIESESEISLRFILLERLGMQIGKMSDFESEKLQGWLTSIKREYGSAIYRGALQEVGATDWDLQRKFEVGLSLCLEAPDEAKQGCYEGLGLVQGEEESLGVFKHFDGMTKQLQKEYLPAFLKGVGESVVFDVEITKKFLTILDVEERKWFVEGLEAGLLKVEDPFDRREIKEKWIHLIR